MTVYKKVCTDVLRNQFYSASIGKFNRENFYAAFFKLLLFAVIV